MQILAGFELSDRLQRAPFYSVGEIFVANIRTTRININPWITIIVDYNRVIIIR